MPKKKRDPFSYLRFGMTGPSDVCSIALTQPMGGCSFTQQTPDLLIDDFLLLRFGLAGFFPSETYRAPVLVSVQWGGVGWGAKSLCPPNLSIWLESYRENTEHEREVSGGSGSAVRGLLV